MYTVNENLEIKFKGFHPRIDPIGFFSPRSVGVINRDMPINCLKWF